jgi:N-acetyltransferase
MADTLSSITRIEPRALVGMRVVLEPLSLAHLDALVAVGLDPEIWRLTRVKLRTRDDMRAYVETALDEQARGLSLPFVIRLEDAGPIVGCTRYGSLDLRNRRAEIGWSWIGRPWQRSFVNTEAKWLMLRQAFEEWCLARVEFKADALNTVSRAALLRLGAREECFFRHHYVGESGRLHDTIYFSILDDEWPSVKAGLETKLKRA